MSEPYELTSPGPRDRPPRAGAGRPRGAKNHTSKVYWRIAQLNTAAIIQKVCVAALAGDMKAAAIILNRTWPEPRGAPIAVNIAQLGGAALIEAVEAGDLTPADAAALMRARSQAIDVSPGSAPVADAREELAKRLMRAIAARPQEPQNGDSGHQNGFHNAPSSDQSAAENLSGDIGTRVEQAVQTGDVSALEAIAAELERG